MTMLEMSGARFSALEETIGKLNRDRGIARHTSTKKLLLDHMEDDGDQLGEGRRRAAFNAGLGWQSALLGQDDGCKEL